MNSGQYAQNVKVMKHRHEKELGELAIRYAKENNPFKVGDLFTDHIGTIRIEKIQVHIGMDEPSCVFYGPIINKDGGVSKRNESRHAYQSNQVTSEVRKTRRKDLKY